jgi:hypothetical protein
MFFWRNLLFFILFDSPYECAGRENRTPIYSLEGYHSTIKLCPLIYFFGIINIDTIYANRPGIIPVNIIISAHNNRSITGSVLKYSPIPPHTPANILFV